MATSYSPEEDDLLLEFGVPPNAFAVRPALERAIAESVELRHRDTRAQQLPLPLPARTPTAVSFVPYRGGTCEHTDQWAAAQSRLLLNSSERSSGSNHAGAGSGERASDFLSHVDEVDQQLADLVDVIGLAASKPTGGPGGLPPELAKAAAAPH